MFLTTVADLGDKISENKMENGSENMLPCKIPCICMFCIPFYILYYKMSENAKYAAALFTS